MKWFPDRRGLAAFRLGAAVAPQLIQFCLDYFLVLPQFLGENVPLQTLEDGMQVLLTGTTAVNEGTKVVVASRADAMKLGIDPGTYVLGTGDNGVAKSLAALGLFYGVVGSLSSRFMSIPLDEWKPHPDFKHDSECAAGMTIGLPVEMAMRTPQFPLL